MGNLEKKGVAFESSEDHRHLIGNAGIFKGRLGAGAGGGVYPGRVCRLHKHHAAEGKRQGIIGGREGGLLS